MLTLIHGGEVYSPDACGVKHIVVGGKHVLEVSDPSDAASLAHALLSTPVDASSLRVIDATGLILTPGFIDCHAHVIGGGGEKGPESRTPPISGASMVRAGVTSVVGLLGTDCISRTSQDLHMKVKAINSYGLTGYMHTGSYKLPVRNTLTGHVDHDIVHVAEVIGVGEICVSDFRGDLPGGLELARLATQAKVAGMLSGKAGTVHVHIGALSSALRPLLEAVERHEVPINCIQPTHCGNRGPEVLDQVRTWLRLGGFADFTADEPRWGNGEHATSDALHALRTEGVGLKQLTVSSDGHGSFSVFDASGNVTSYGMFEQTNLGRTLARLVSLGWPYPDALKLCTVNVAQVLQLPHKGRLAVGCDADVLVWDPREAPLSTAGLRYVFANGVLLKDGSWVRPDLF